MQHMEFDCLNILLKAVLIPKEAGELSHEAEAKRAEICQPSDRAMEFIERENLSFKAQRRSGNRRASIFTNSSHFYSTVSESLKNFRLMPFRLDKFERVFFYNQLGIKTR